MDVGISEKHISKDIMALRLEKMAKFVENAIDWLLRAAQVARYGEYFEHDTSSFPNYMD